MPITYLMMIWLLEAVNTAYTVMIPEHRLSYESYLYYYDRSIQREESVIQIIVIENWLLACTYGRTFSHNPSDSEVQVIRQVHGSFERERRNKTVDLFHHFPELLSVTAFVERRIWAEVLL